MDGPILPHAAFTLARPLICAWCSTETHAVDAFCFLLPEPKSSSHGMCASCFDEWTRGGSPALEPWRTLRLRHLGLLDDKESA